MIKLTERFIYTASEKSLVTYLSKDKIVRIYPSSGNGTTICLINEVINVMESVEEVLLRINNSCIHEWREVAIGDPSIGGSMVSRFHQCIQCGKEQ